MSMKRNYFSVLFYIKKAKLLKNGKPPIKCKPPIKYPLSLYL